MERALMCPQCNAPLAPSRFARSVVCSYCGATVQLDASSISAETFHKAFRAWNSPQSYSFPSWLSIGDSHWAVDEMLGKGDVSDVYSGKRARWPTELVLIKVLRDLRDLPQLDNEWEAVKNLQASNAPGADTFTTLIPEPIIHGTITAGAFEGRRANIFRWTAGFHHTFEAVQRAYPQGIPPRASIWVWRRILEVLAFIHNSGMVHGAVLPPHLLVQENEHGVRLVGYGRAGYAGRDLTSITPGYEAFHPKSNRARPTLTTQLDLIMSARCVVALLGGNPADASLPGDVPVALARLIQRVALSNPADSTDNAWALREELGGIANNVFGAPQFIPIVMPS